MEKLLAKLEQYLVYALVFLFPIVALPISPNPYVVPKLAVLVYGVSLILLVKLVRIFLEGKLEWSVGKFDFPVALLAVSYVVAAILRTPNKMEAMLLPGIATAIAGGALLYYLVNQYKDNVKSVIGRVLLLSGAVYSLFTALAFSGLFSKIPQLPAFMQAQSFSPEGGFLPSAIFLATLLPIGIGLVMSEKEKTNKLLSTVAVVVVAFGFAISVYNLIPGRPFAPRFPSYAVSWSVSIDALKESPIFGIGPGNYLSAFNRYRPITYNTTDLWAIKFATARSYFFTMLTEVGMLGMAAIVLLVLAVYRKLRKDFKEIMAVKWGFAASAKLVSLVLLILAMAVFPATALLLVLFFILLSLNSDGKKTTLNLTAQQAAGDAPQIAGISTQQVATRFPALLITVPLVIAVGLVVVRSTRIVRAEYKFQQALNALVRNEAQSTYDLMREAIQLNPQVDRYHSTFSRINLILANAIAQNPEITDQDRATITQLIQQAINEGKATVALNPLRAGSWETLAQTYQAIIPFAQGADAFAVQALRQAVALDPVNPNTRIALGGIHYARQDYLNAINIFQVVTTAVKPDLANAHYNLAFAYREAGQIDAAINELTLVLSLVDRTTPDYEVARQALEDLQQQKRAEAPAGGDLTPPAEAPEPVITPPIELEEDAAPPESPLSPTPTPEEGAEGEEAELTPTPTPRP